jgi:hypothetical protein
VISIQNTEKHLGRISYEDKAENWVILLKAKEHQISPAKHQQLRETHGTDSYL